MGRVYELSESQKSRNRDYNAGYADGYAGEIAEVGRADAYYTGYDVGVADKAEDNEAIASGDYDPMEADEMREIYGDESDQV